MSNFLKMLIGVVILVVGSIVLWYLSAREDVSGLNKDIASINQNIAELKDEVRDLRSGISTLAAQFARIDERTKLSGYNAHQLEATSQVKNIPQSKVDTAKKYLDTKPPVKDAVKYLESGLGFSPPEVNAVIGKQYQNELMNQPSQFGIQDD